MAKTKTMVDYMEGAQECVKRISKEMTVEELGFMKYICFVVGLLFATWFPNFAKKCRAIFVTIGIVLMIPLLIRAVWIFRDVFCPKGKRR